MLGRLYRIVFPKRGVVEVLPDEGYTKKQAHVQGKRRYYEQPIRPILKNKEIINAV